MSQGNTVRIVLDPEFGEAFERLTGGGPVWIIDSPAKTPVAHRLWKFAGDFPSWDLSSGARTPRRWGWGTPLKKRTATRIVQILCIFVFFVNWLSRIVSRCDAF